MVGAHDLYALYDTASDQFIFISRKGLLMELHQLPSFLMERWFAEFEFVPGMRNLAASGPFAVKTDELLGAAKAFARRLQISILRSMQVIYISHQGRVKRCFC